MDWFRSWHGAPTDSKWLLIAKRSETQAGIVSAIVWALFDFASQNSAARGNVEAFDVETYAAFSGFDDSTIRRIIECLKEKKLIIDGHLAAWEKRQTKREDNSTPRVQKHRNAVKRNVTQETAREEKIREEKIDSEAIASGAVAPDLSIPQREYFLRGREVLGNKSGAMIANLLKAKGKNIALARAALEEASQKQSPMEFVAAVCRGPPISSRPLTEFQRGRNETKDILNDLDNFAAGSSGSGQENPRLLSGDSSERSEGIRRGPGCDISDLPTGRYRSGG